MSTADDRPADGSGDRPADGLGDLPVDGAGDRSVGGADDRPADGSGGTDAAGGRPAGGADAIVLRDMTAADVPTVHGLEQVLFPDDAWTERMLREELSGQPRSRRYVIAETSGGEIVGYAGLASAGGQADVQTIGVAPGHRGAGIGALLLTELIDEAVRRRSEGLFLEVRVDNAPARRLYERFGFEQIGIRERYYQPADVDAAVMFRRLRERPPVGFTREDS